MGSGQTFGGHYSIYRQVNILVCIDRISSAIASIEVQLQEAENLRCIQPMSSVA
jgi:hypothetical protein